MSSDAGSGKTPSRFSTFVFLMQGLLWGVLVALSGQIFYSALNLLYDLIFSFEFISYWLPALPGVLLFEVLQALILGAIEGFSIAVALHILMLVLRGRMSMLISTLTGAVVGALGGAFYLLLQGMLNSEGACTDASCWALDILAFIGVPALAGSWLGWRLVRSTGQTV